MDRKLFVDDIPTNKKECENKLYRYLVTSDFIILIDIEKKEETVQMKESPPFCFYSFSFVYFH